MTEPQDAYLETPSGIRLHYRNWGGSGDPLVLLHGLASSCRIWDFTAPLLAQHFRVLALDQGGHGLSDKPVMSGAEGPRSYTFAEVTADLAAFIEKLDLERPVIAGHSWGGCVAVEFAAAYSAVPSGIALVDGGFIGRFFDTTWEEAELMMRPPQIDGVPVQTLVGFAKKWPDVGALWSDQLEEMILSNFEIRDGKVYRRLPIPDHMKIAREIWEQRPTELYPRIRCPVLMVPAIKETSDARAEMWAKAKMEGIEAAKGILRDLKVVVMEDTIHDIPIQRPKELANAIIEFGDERRLA
jgi:pimeloyl-ACP methyl ester carboxylesterase